MDEKLMLMLPGPTPVPEKALLSIAKPTIGHRSKPFSVLLEEVTENLRWLHQTQSDVYTLTASGTGAMEAGIINVLSPGDRVLVGVNGKFGQRWAQIAETFGMQCERIESDWGVPYSVEIFQEKLESDTEKTIKAVILTHSETSSGVLNDVQGIAALAKAHGEALVIVDGVTSVGAVSVPMDEWGLDIVASGSQKAYMLPPGLGFVAVSQRAWAATERSTLPKFYWSFKQARSSLHKGTTPFTPSVNLIYGLQTTLQMMRQEGLTELWQRHARLAAATRSGVKALGLQLLPNPESAASPTVTAVCAPPDIDADQIRSLMLKQFDIALAAGQDHLKGKIFRIGHMGFVSDRDILMTLSALESVLHTAGYTDFTAGAGIKAASDIMAST